MVAARWQWRMVGLAILAAFPLTMASSQEPGPSTPPVPHRPAWAGIYPTVLTPWRPGGGVDQASLAAQIAYELRGGVHGLLLLGTIGEGQFATYAERADVIRTAVACTRGCVPIVVGIHTCNLDVAKAQLIQAKNLGANAVLVKYAGDWGATGPDVYAFFAELSAWCSFPIFYYHYPSQTGLKLTPEDVAAILWLPNVVGIKESTLNLKEVEQHLELTRGANRVFLSGTALNLTQFVQLGGHGAMCAEGVLLPAKTARAFEACAAADFAAAREIQKELFVIAPVLRGGMGNPGITRTIMMTAEDNQLCLPMGGDEPQARLKAALNGLCIPTTPIVKCQYPKLSYLDQRAVERAMKAIRAAAAEDAGPFRYHPPAPGYSSGDRQGTLLPGR